MNTLNYLPIALAVSGAPITIVGGSDEGVRKAQRLARLTTAVTFVAPHIPNSVRSLGFVLKEKNFEDSDLDGVRVLFICTSDSERNHALYRLAHDRGILACVCDDKPYCDFISPAIVRQDNVTIAVGSDGSDVHRSIRIRNRIKQLIESGLLDMS